VPAAAATDKFAKYAVAKLELQTSRQQSSAANVL